MVCNYSNLTKNLALVYRSLIVRLSEAQVNRIFPADAYAISKGNTLVLQLVSQAARSIPELTPDKDGVLIVPVAEAEAALSLLEEAQVSIMTLG